MSQKKTPKSYMVGIIALMFLLIGYQTALFVHRAAVVSIAASRDEPDTVYVIETIPTGEISAVDSKSESGQRSHKPYGSEFRNSSSASSVPDSRTTPYTRSGYEKESADGQKGATQSVMVRKNAKHSSVVQAVRNNVPRRNVESFPFNPNTASIDELCRLGFSPRQAQSIDNYRKKGGRFRRKADFAKSYVVSDSIYRRLEPYIDIPLIDLNLADSAAFESLPGVGGWTAAAIIKHRIALGGYSDKRQLMDIRSIDSLRYANLEELVTVSPSHITPYPLWSLPADSLKKHPYIRTFRLAKAIVLYRENNPLDRHTVRGLLEAGVINEDCAGKLSLCRLL